jgi:Domain of unknown function (DU1801)
MAQNKTTENQNSIEGYLKTILDEKKRNDFTFLLDKIAEATGIQPKMWGTAIVGFGSYHYKYDSGREGDAPLFGLSARVNAISLYFTGSMQDRAELLSKLGKYKSAKSCVYINKVEDINMDVFINMVKNSIEAKNHQC